MSYVFGRATQGVRRACVRGRVCETLARRGRSARRQDVPSVFTGSSARCTHVLEGVHVSTSVPGVCRVCLRLESRLPPKDQVESAVLGWRLAGLVLLGVLYHRLSLWVVSEI